MNSVKDFKQESIPLDVLFRAVAEAGRVLIETRDLDTGLAEAVGLLGQLTGFHRAYLFEFIAEDGYYLNRVDWVRPPYLPVTQINPVWKKLPAALVPEIHARFLAKDVWTSHVPDRHGFNADLNEESNCKSDAILPIYVDKTLWGAIGFDWCESIREFSLVEIGALRGAATCIAAAVKRQRIEAAATETIALERERASQDRAFALAKTNDALQAITDALRTIENLDAFVPEVLSIVSRTFGAISSAYFEIREDDTVFLRYWRYEGRVLNPEDLLLIDPVRFGLVKFLAAGFTVPAEYLGKTPSRCNRAVFLDHQAGTVVPEFDAFALSLNWGAELNVPLVVNGISHGSIVIYREAGNYYSDYEIALAETLAKQFALAVETSTLFRQTRQRAVEAAIAREQKEAAQLRAAELARANESLRESLSELAAKPEPRAFLGTILLQASRLLSSDTGHLALIDETSGSVITYAHCADNSLEPEPKFSTAVPVSEVGAIAVMAAAAAPRFFDLQTETHLFWPGTVEWHRQFGTRSVLAVPMLSGPKMVGFLGFAFRREISLSPERAELLMALAHQAALACELIRLAEIERDSAIANERTRLARDIHDSMAQSFTSIAMQTEALISQSSPDGLFGITLERIAQTARLGLSEARATALTLIPLENRVGALDQALRDLAERSSIHDTIACHFSSTGDATLLPLDQQEGLLRIAQEAINNALKYSKCTNVSIRLAYRTEGVKLAVQDDGVGIPNGANRAGGMGLKGMKARAEELGGRFDIVAAPPYRTSVEIVLPTIHH